MLRGGILAINNFDVAKPHLQMMHGLLVRQFKTTRDKVRVGVDTSEGRLVPSFGIAEDVAAAAGFSPEQAEALVRDTWQYTRRLLVARLARASERWRDWP